MEDVTKLKNIYKTANQGNFPDELNLILEKEADLRYGENPNQTAAAYSFKASELAKLTDIKLLKSGKGGLSANNMMDVTRALEILKFFDKPSCAVMKHLIPSGFATQFEGNSLLDIYKNARDADARSAFGSVVVFNREVDSEIANEIMATYVEAVAAPSFSDDAVNLLNEKKSMRLIVFSNLDKIPKFVGDDSSGLFDLKALPSGRVIVQNLYLSKIKSAEDLNLNPKLNDNDGVEHVIKRAPTTQELSDLFTAWYVNLGVRSNGIVIVKNGVTICVGSGQQERVGAVEQAIIKSYQKAMDREGIPYDPIDGGVKRNELSSNPMEGAVLSSDAFFPFRDSIDLISKHGIKAIIQPGGSIRDDEVIDACNESDVAMVFTLERCFGHF